MEFNDNMDINAMTRTHPFPFSLMTSSIGTFKPTHFPSDPIHSSRYSSAVTSLPAALASITAAV